jgi:hypothetical protein
MVGSSAGAAEPAAVKVTVDVKKGVKHVMTDEGIAAARAKARVEPRRGHKRASTQPLPELETEVHEVFSPSAGAEIAPASSSVPAATPSSSPSPSTRRFAMPSSSPDHGLGR